MHGLGTRSDATEGCHEGRHRRHDRYDVETAQPDATDGPDTQVGPSGVLRAVLGLAVGIVAGLALRLVLRRDADGPRGSGDPDDGTILSG